jgi:hypothetical protein
MIDTDKYEGHTEGPWVVKKGERMRVWHQKNEMTSTLICSMQATHCEPQDADAQLIADAPLLLAEVLRLRKGIIDIADKWERPSILRGFLKELKEMIE